MKLNITLASTAVTFEFDTPRDRDTFWNGMEKCGFLSQGAAERLGTRGINITTAKIRTGYAWPFEALPGSANGDVQVKQVEKKVEAPQPETQPETQPVLSATEPLPTIPIPQLTAVPAVIPTATTQAKPEPVAAPTTTTPPADPEPTGIHKNSRQYRAWKARQK